MASMCQEEVLFRSRYVPDQARSNAHTLEVPDPNHGNVILDTVPRRERGAESLL